jgi:hypothetical protein
MNVKGRLTCTLMAALPHNEQQAMVRDFMDWPYADLPPAERQEKGERLSPRLIEWISEGKTGLWLVFYQYLKRLSPGWAMGRVPRGVAGDRFDWLGAPTGLIGLARLFNWSV